MDFKEKIMKTADLNTEAKKKLFKEVFNKTKTLTGKESEWIYYPFKKEFVYFIPDFTITEEFYSNVILEKNFPGISVSIRKSAINAAKVIVTIKDHDNDKMLFYVTNLLKNLKVRREELFHNWCKEKEDFIRDFFYKHNDSDDVIHNMDIVRSKTYQVWAPTLYREDPNIIDFGHIFNIDYEFLNESDFVPCLWKSNEELETSLRVGPFKINIERKHLLDPSFKIDWPEIFVYFTVEDYDKSCDLLLDIVRSNQSVSKMRSVLEVCEDIMDNDYWTNESGVPTLYLPLHEYKYGEYVVDKVNILYHGLLRSELCTKTFMCLSEEMPAIKVTLIQ